MPLPETYLCQAPEGVENQLGRCLSSTQLVKMLKRCNPEIVVPTPEQVISQGFAFSSAHLEGQTSIWWGTPPVASEIERSATKPNKKALKITSIVLGPAIPEFTQFNPEEGLIEQKGWREVLRRVIMCGAATKEKVEKVFKVSLDYEGTERVCKACEKKGLRTRGYGANCLCVDHRMATMGIQERQDYLDYIERQMVLKGESQVGFTTHKENACLSSPSQVRKPPQRTSGSTLKPQNSTPSGGTGESGPVVTLS